ncbi:hypothetical protein A9O67_11525 [Tepidimonas fonticaldi]|uniref:DUF2889 domain-containing protein n=2 Tax=Tepidimonas fonticaldi TaxID=1101373 RepID=A0A1A6DYG2_9BURK|nr:hypothetical protein A9O67_11525 [Tepidimonas fonticaldi]
MPLPPPAARQPMHTRRVEFRGYRRDDGLWDIEAELTDVKPYGFEIEGEGAWSPGQPIHHMHLRVTLDDAWTIRDIAVAMDAHPHAPCPQTMAPLRGLIGERMGRGWRKIIEQRMGGERGCTHLRDLLVQLATAAFQTRAPDAFAPGDDGSPPPHLGTCLTWAFDSPVVQRRYPLFYRPRASQEAVS